MRFAICPISTNQRSQHWNEVLSRREQTVLISFGSLAKSYLLRPDAKRALLKVQTIIELKIFNWVETALSIRGFQTVSRFPNVTFIWKYERPDDEFSLGYASKLDNLVLSKWMPQNDILGSMYPIFMFQSWFQLTTNWPYSLLTVEWAQFKSLHSAEFLVNILQLLGTYK